MSFEEENKMSNCEEKKETCDITTSEKTLYDLYQLYKKGQIIKPKMQRKICWVKKKSNTKTNNYEFIKFIIDIGHLVNPLLFVQRIEINQKKYYAIDGNNRINAILDFIEKPLDLFDEFITEYDEQIQHKLKNLSYSDLISRKLTRSYYHFCEKYKLLDIHEKTKNMGEKFDNMIDTFVEYNIFNARVPITIFDNISDEKICEIYESINKGGIKLTKQDILASTLSNIKYKENEISKYYNILKSYIIEYYNDSNKTEKLDIKEINIDSLNLYEILLSFQIYLKKQFHSIPKIGDGQLDFIFKVYEYIHNDIKFTKKNNDIHIFLDNIFLICQYINDILKKFYNSKINHRSIKKYNKKLVLKKNTITVIICYLYKNINKLNNIKKDMTKIFLYNELCSMISKNNNKKDIFFSKNPLRYNAGGSYITNMCNNLLKGTTTLDVPNLDIINEILDNILFESIDNCIKNNSKKRNYKKIQFLLLSLYINKFVPTNQLHSEKNIEHIFPFSSDWNNELDINRLGNLIFIDSNINKKRSTNRITNDFINQNKLHYLNYPTQEEYDNIITLKNFIYNDKYNKLCKEREKKYIQNIIDDLN